MVLKFIGFNLAEIGMGEPLRKTALLLAVARAYQRAYIAAALVLIVVLAAELVLSIRQQSQTIDEGQHIFAGRDDAACASASWIS